MLLNFASSEIPATLFLICEQLAGMTDKDLGQHGIVAALTVEGAPVPVYNQGGVIGYNVLYSMASSSVAWDVTSLPLLTFDIAITTDGTPLTYPLQDPLTLNLEVTSVTF